MNTNKTLNNISMLAFAFVAVVVIVNLFTTNNYGRANRQVLASLSGTGHMANYQLLRNIANGSEADTYLLVDLRSHDDFIQGHLPGAINIPFDELLDGGNLRKLSKKSGKTPVLYADAEARAQTARMLLLAKGFDENIMVLGGSYKTALAFGIEKFEPSYANYKDEKARFDFRRFMNTGNEAAPVRPARPQGVLPAVNVQVAGAQGGC